MTTRRGFFRLLGCGLLIPCVPKIFLPPAAGWPRRTYYRGGIEMVQATQAYSGAVEFTNAPTLGNVLVVLARGIGEFEAPVGFDRICTDHHSDGSVTALFSKTVDTIADQRVTFGETVQAVIAEYDGVRYG